MENWSNVRKVSYFCETKLEKGKYCKIVSDECRIVSSNGKYQVVIGTIVKVSCRDSDSLNEVRCMSSLEIEVNFIPNCFQKKILFWVL